MMKGGVLTPAFWKRLAQPSKGWTALLFLLVFAFLGYMVYREREAFFAFSWQVQPVYFLPVIVLHVAACVSMSLVWHLMAASLSSFGDWKHNLYVYTVSLVARRVPTPIWFIGSRYVMYNTAQVPPQVLTLMTALEIGLIGLAGILCYVLYLPFYSFSVDLPGVLVLAVTGVLFAALFLHPQMIVRLINLVFRLIKQPAMDVRVPRRRLFAWTLLYTLTWVLDGTALYFMALSVIGPQVRYADVMGVSTISAYAAYISQFLPISFALKEATMSALFGLWIPVGVGAVIAVVFRVALTVIEILMVAGARWLVREPAAAK